MSTKADSGEITVVQSGERGTQPPRDVGAEPFPAVSDRYQLAEALGRGAMGIVYRAYDTLLSRHVALKVLHEETPERVGRFLQEARAQARVTHEHVCKVFDVGTGGGKPYIAMQLVEGVTLQAARAEMGTEERARVMSDVCDGVHAAHRSGLIHRDLKPSNIMVERREGGSWHAYVLDFGLARDPEAQGLTVTGMTVGTPAYMAPEQARGRSDLLDRRTDVYGLGATLYELLTGRPPFSGLSGVEVMMKVLDQDPVPPRRREPSVPRDLETIVMRCLEKEPDRRYESARALAEDLRRYLDGEPVAARAPSLAYRIVKRVRKHRVLSGVVAVALLSLLALGTVAVKARVEASARARVAQRFGQEVKDIEAILRYAALSPLHDVGREKGIVRERMKRIAEEARRVGPAAAGPAAYALGRGHLALQELRAARRELEAAVEADPAFPDAHLALGQTLGLLYKKEMELASSIRDPAARQRRRDLLDAEYRIPLLRHLKASAGSDAASEYVEGLLAFHQGRYTEALEKAARAQERLPWLYEARFLEGEVRTTEADAALDRGRYEEALAGYEKAEGALREGLRLGESDSRGHELLCWTFSRVLWMEINQRGRPIEPWLSKAKAACADAVRADGDSGGALTKTSTVLYLEAQHRIAAGEDPTDILRQAEEASRRAVELDPESVVALNTLGNVHRSRAQWEAGHAMDTTRSNAAATEAYRRAVRIAPNPVVLGNLGLVLSSAADEARLRGGDPRPFLREAIDALEHALRLDPEYLLALNNLGFALMSLGQWEAGKGLDPTRSLEEAARWFRAASEKNPGFAWAMTNLGQVLVVRAEYEGSRGRDAQPFLDDAARVLRRSLEVNPKHLQTHLVLGVALMDEAQLALGYGRDPGETLRASEEALGRAIELDPRDLVTCVNLVVTASERVRFAYLAGLEPAQGVRMTREALERCRKIDPTFGLAYLIAARAYLWQARDQLLRGLSPAEALSEAERLVASGRRFDQGSFEGPLREGEARLVRARWELGRGRPAAALLDDAARAAEEARRLNEGDADVALLEAEIARTRAAESVRRGEKPAPWIEAGLAAAERGLKINPKHAGLHAATGELLLLREGPGSRASGHAFDRALELNPLLRREHRDR